MDRHKVLLTGGSGGIGKAIINRLEKEACYEVVAPRRDELDLSSNDSIKDFFSKSNEYSIVINNAGVNYPQNITDIEESRIKETLSVNLESPILIIKNCVSYMKRIKFGRIVNVSSIWGIRSKEKRTLYSAAKFGVNGITKALARELGPYNILVNSICPGYVDTSLTQKNISYEEQIKIKAEIPLRRFADPNEIAESIAFLIDKRNTYITGHTLIIDGGFLA